MWKLQINGYDEIILLEAHDIIIVSPIRKLLNVYFSNTRRRSIHY